MIWLISCQTLPTPYHTNSTLLLLVPHQFFQVQSDAENLERRVILNLGFILLCEYLYFRRNGYSFIEQMSLNHLSPWINPEDGPQNQLERPVRQSNTYLWSL